MGCFRFCLATTGTPVRLTTGDDNRQADDTLLLDSPQGCLEPVSQGTSETAGEDPGRTGVPKSRNRRRDEYETETSR